MPAPPPPKAALSEHTAYVIYIQLIPDTYTGTGNVAAVKLLILLYMCPHTALCPHTAIHVSSYCCICARTAIYVSSYYRCRQCSRSQAAHQVGRARELCRCLLSLLVLLLYRYKLCKCLLYCFLIKLGAHVNCACTQFTCCTALLV
jgi:cobalamin synthase